MDISVILSTWNNSNRLRITLESISQCKVPDDVLWELVIVNNNCTDETDEVAHEFADKLPILYIKEPRQGLSRAKNAGIKAATGKLIIFTDDDVKPCSEWITIYWSAYQANPRGYFWGGPIESEFENRNIDEELIRLAPPSVQGLSYGCDQKTLAPGEYLVAANWACPAEAIRTAGGFDISTGLNPASGKVIVGEETDLMDRLLQMGLIEFYLPEAGIKHFVPEDKCSLGHILSRLEASQEYWAKKYKINQSNGFIGRVPYDMYRQFIIYWFKWIYAKIRGQKGYGLYLKWRCRLAKIRSIRKC